MKRTRKESKSDQVKWKTTPFRTTRNHRPTGHRCVTLGITCLLVCLVILWGAGIIYILRKNCKGDSLPALSNEVVGGGDNLAIVGDYQTIPDDRPDKKPIQVVYALPSEKPKGIVLLLHACTHNAFKFFSPHPDRCPDCVGLSEELRIVRLVLQAGYLPIAISCFTEVSGCWANIDIPRVEKVVRWSSIELLGSNSQVGQLPVYAIGASSGGDMAATVGIEGIADASLVMVMGLRQKIQQAWIEKASNGLKVPKVYLAPMPRDQRTLHRNEANYREMAQVRPEAVVLDGTSCEPVSLTEEFLTGRVPNLGSAEARHIVDALVEEKHLDSDTLMFLKNPTRSDWRDVLMNLQWEPEEKNPFAGGNAEEVLWGHLVLTGGLSPLAKAFHRAWGYHEYCSEVVLPALEFFEKA